MAKTQTITNEETLGGEIGESMSREIQNRVETYRAIKADIAILLEQAGVTEQEARLELIKAELQDLTKSYHELTGVNWQDDQGYAQYRQAGEQNRYDREVVDQVLTALLALQAHMANQIIDTPIRFAIKQGDETIFANSLELMDSPLDKLAMAQALAQSEQVRIKGMQDISLALDAMDENLKKLAEARKTSTVKESVAIR